MDDELLDLCLREYSLDGIPETRQAIYAGKQDTNRTLVLQAIQHSQPEPGEFVCAYCDAQGIFVFSRRNPKDVCSALLAMRLPSYTL